MPSRGSLSLIKKSQMTKDSNSQVQKLFEDTLVEWSLVDYKPLAEKLGTDNMPLVWKVAEMIEEVYRSGMEYAYNRMNYHYEDKL